MTGAYFFGMAKQAKRSRDPNQLGKLIVEWSVAETEERTSQGSSG
jgi:hypothetical protein